MKCGKCGEPWTADVCRCDREREAAADVSSKGDKLEPLRAPWEGRSVSLTIARQHWDAMPSDVRAEVERLCHGVRFEFGAVPSVECGPLAENGAAHSFVLVVCERFGVVALVERAS